MLLILLGITYAYAGWGTVFRKMSLSLRRYVYGKKVPPPPLVPLKA